MAEGINLLKDLAGQMYGKLVEEPTAGEIVTFMQQMVDKLEAIGNAYKASIEEKLSQIALLLDGLEDEDQEKKEAQEGEVESEKAVIGGTLDGTFDWSGETQVSEIPLINASMPQYQDNPSQFEIDWAYWENQTRAAAQALKVEREGLVAGLIARKHTIYSGHLKFNDGNDLNKHPNFEQKISNNDFRSKTNLYNGTAYPGLRIYVNDFINPKAYFYGPTSYANVKQLISDEGPGFLTEEDTRIQRFEDYITVVEEFLGDQDIKNSLDSWMQRYNGLKGPYLHYTLQPLNWLPSDFSSEKAQIGAMLYTGSNHDYAWLKTLENNKSRADTIMNNFAADAASFESELGAAFTGGSGESYSGLLGKLNTRATDLLDAYNGLQTLHNNSPYITFIDGEPRVNDTYITNQLNSADPAERELVKQAIKSALQEIRNQEVAYIETFDAELTNVRFAAGCPREARRKKYNLLCHHDGI